MVSTKQGTLIRTQVDQISVIGRNTQGVRVIRLDKDDEVTAIARIEAEVDEDEDTELDENGEPIERSESDSDAPEDDGEAKENSESDVDEDNTP